MACKKADGSDYYCSGMATFALAEIIKTHWITCKGETTDRNKCNIATKLSSLKRAAPKPHDTSVWLPWGLIHGLNQKCYFHIERKSDDPSLPSDSTHHQMNIF